MSKPTPFYNPELILGIYGKASTVLDHIHCMSPLPYGQHATDSDINRDIWRRHRKLLAQAGALKGELFELVGETARLAIKRRAVCQECGQHRTWCNQYDCPGAR